MFPRGEKTVGAIVELDKAAKAEAFSVPGRTVLSASANDTIVTLELDPADEKAITRKMVGFGPGTTTKVTGAKLSVKQKGSLFPVKCSQETNEDIDGFKKMCFKTANGELIYHLYEPAAKQGEKLPLMLFMHDSSVVSKNPKAALIQGMGGVIWALPEEQRKRPCYVLVPAYSEKTAFDDFTVTWQCEATAELIADLVKRYPIDERRIYGTGQSMGCMMLYELMYTHPKLFAAAYAVAGQWDPAKIAALKDQNIWILISEKDEKAWPIMNEGLRLLADSGVKISKGHIDAKADDNTKRLFAEEVISQEANIQFTWYEGSSNLPDGMRPFPGCYHLCTWLWAYGIEPIREWVFKHKNNKL